MLPEEVCKQEFSAESTCPLQNRIVVESGREQNIPPAVYIMPVATETKRPLLRNGYLNKIKDESLLIPKVSTKLLIPKEQSEITDIATFLKLSLKTISKIVNEFMRFYKRIAFRLSVHMQCKFSSDTEDLINHESPFIQRNKSLTSHEVVLNSISEIEDTVDVITSLLVLDNTEELSQCTTIEDFHLEITTRELLKRRGSHLKLPSDIMKTGAVLNMRNFDNFCFKWAVIAAVSNKTGKYLQGVRIYKIKDITQEKIHTSGMTLDFSGLDFPVNYWDLRIFEKKNKEISLNVFGREILNDKSSKIIGPLYRTKKGSPCKIHINLLYFENEESDVCHYLYIKSMSRLVRKQVLKSTITVFFCNKCLRHFVCEDSLTRHKCKILNVFM